MDEMVLHEFSNGTKFYWTPTRMGAIKRVFTTPGGSGIYQKRNMDAFHKLFDNPSVVIDVGAHIGMNTIHYARSAQYVFAMEALPFNFKHLTANIQINELNSKVTALNVAAGAASGVVGLVSPSSNTGTTHLDMSKSGITMVNSDDVILPMMRDTWKVDFIKIDTEGYEAGVILGLSEIIIRYRPILQVELIDKHLERYGSTSESVIKMMYSKDYFPLFYNGHTVEPRDYQSGNRPTDIFFVYMGDVKNARARLQR